MSKKNKLSHSSVSTYLSCGYKYKLHYLERLRSKYTHAALLFGSALDKALDQMLQDHKIGRLDSIGHTYVNKFNIHWRESEINGQKVELMENEDIVYAATDIDFKLFSDKDFINLTARLQMNYADLNVLQDPSPQGLIDVYKNVLKRKEANGWEGLHSNERKFYNFVNWCCMARKGELMIKSYLQEIIPRIKRVIETQKVINLEAESGDTVTGFVDLIAEWEDGRVVVFDNKTSARAYEDDAVLKSPQLALYSHALRDELNTKTAGFIVMRKAIDKNATKKCSVCGHDGDGSRAKTCVAIVDGKRCNGAWIEVFRPKAAIQVLINDIPEQLENITLENFSEVNHAIKSEVFPRNLNSCQMGSTWRCPFYDLCHGNSTKNLIKLEDK